jgi:hypothetical protein
MEKLTELFDAAKALQAEAEERPDDSDKQEAADAAYVRAGKAYAIVGAARAGLKLREYVEKVRATCEHEEDWDRPARRAIIYKVEYECSVDAEKRELMLLPKRIEMGQL